MEIFRKVVAVLGSKWFDEQMRVSRAGIAKMRQHAQLLLGAGVASPSEVAEKMLAMQGQDLPGVLYSLGLRTRGKALSEVREAFDSGQLVRSWPMRGTLHVCLAKDLPWILSLTAERTLASMLGRQRQLNISANDIAAVREMAIDVAAGSGVSRDELFSAFEMIGQDTGAQRGIHLINALCIQGQLVQGPFRGNKQLFMVSSEWIKQPRQLERDEALAEIATRYFRSHGPATLADFAWWSKLTLTDARRAMAAMDQSFVVLEHAGTEYFVAEELLAQAPSGVGSRSVFLLPGFDENLLGYADRSAALAAEHAARIVPGNNGMFMPTIVYGGSVIGTWRKPSAASGARADVELEPFAELPPKVLAAARRASTAYLQFLHS